MQTAANHTRVTWHVSAGDASYVSIPGVVKPIACGSKERARLIAAAPELLEALMATEAALNWENYAGSPEPWIRQGQDREAALQLRRAAIAKAGG